MTNHDKLEKLKISALLIANDEEYENDYHDINGYHTSDYERDNFYEYKFNLLNFLDKYPSMDMSIKTTNENYGRAIGGGIGNGIGYGHGVLDSYILQQSGYGSGYTEDNLFNFDEWSGEHIAKENRYILIPIDIIIANMHV